MYSSTAPTVPEGPGNSTQANEPTVNLLLQKELRIEASIEYQKAVREQVAKDILEIIKKQEEAASALGANPQEKMAARVEVEATEAMVEAKAAATENVKVRPSNDLQLFETLI